MTLTAFNFERPPDALDVVGAAGAALHETAI